MADADVLQVLEPDDPAILPVLQPFRLGNREYQGRFLPRAATMRSVPASVHVSMGANSACVSSFEIRARPSEWVLLRNMTESLDGILDPSAAPEQVKVLSGSTCVRFASVSQASRFVNRLRSPPRSQTPFAPVPPGVDVFRIESLDRLHSSRLYGTRSFEQGVLVGKQVAAPSLPLALPLAQALPLPSPPPPPPPPRAEAMDGLFNPGVSVSIKAFIQRGEGDEGTAGPYLSSFSPFPEPCDTVL